MFDRAHQKRVNHRAHNVCGKIYQLYDHHHRKCIELVCSIVYCGECGWIVELSPKCRTRSTQTTRRSRRHTPPKEPSVDIATTTLGQPPYINKFTMKIAHCEEMLQRSHDRVCWLGQEAPPRLVVNIMMVLFLVTYWLVGWFRVLDVNIELIRLDTFCWRRPPTPSQMFVVHTMKCGKYWMRNSLGSLIFNCIESAVNGKLCIVFVTPFAYVAVICAQIIYSVDCK